MGYTNQPRLNVNDCLNHHRWVEDITDVLPPNLVKSRICEIGCYNNRIAFSSEIWQASRQGCRGPGLTHTVKAKKGLFASSKYDQYSTFRIAKEYTMSCKSWSWYNANNAESPSMPWRYHNLSIGWLEPLLQRIALNSTTVVCPFIESINDTDFRAGESGLWSMGGFDWDLIFQWKNPNKQREAVRVGKWDVLT